MDFSLTEEQELLLASIRELITTNFPEEYFRTCDQNGLSLIHISEPTRHLRISYAVLCLKMGGPPPPPHFY
ncbi:hypothetical protein ACX3V1_15385, partial [Escherichia coli]